MVHSLCKLQSSREVSRLGAAAKGVAELKGEALHLVRAELRLVEQHVVVQGLSHIRSGTFLPSRPGIFRQDGEDEVSLHLGLDRYVAPLKSLTVSLVSIT